MKLQGKAGDCRNGVRPDASSKGTAPIPRIQRAVARMDEGMWGGEPVKSSTA